MKLLNPREVKSKAEDEQTLSLLRTQELMAAEKQARQNLARAEVDFNSTLAKNRELWAIEEQNHNERVREREREIDVLEAKRLNALIPFEIIKSGTNDRFTEASAYLADIKEREQNVEEVRDLLEDKLDRVGQREVDLNARAQRLDLREEGIKRQDSDIKIGSQKLTLEIEQFRKNREVVLKELEQRETAIVLQERTLLAKAETNKRTDKVLSELAIRLADERSTLDRAWAELKRKYPTG